MSTRVEPGIDAAWLERLAASEPLRHAWAVWDRMKFPDRVEFRTLFEDGVPTAYLLFWHGSPKVPMVHWVGSPKDPGPLLDALPPRPVSVVAPESLALAIERRRAPARIAFVHWMAFEPGTPVEPVPERRARRLAAPDQPALAALARQHPDVLTTPYATADPSKEPIFGAFDWGRLGGVARAQVALPKVWVIGGVYTVP